MRFDAFSGIRESHHLRLQTPRADEWSQAGFCVAVHVHQHLPMLGESIAYLVTLERLPA